MHSHTSHFKHLYEGHKLEIVLAGGGFSLFDLLKVPGASKFIESISVPYGFDSMKHYMSHGNKNSDNTKIVSAEGVAKCMKSLIYQAKEKNARLYNQFQTAHKNTVEKKYVVVSASLTTDRYRHGNNEAFIAILGQGIFHVELDKLSHDEKWFNDDANRGRIQVVRYMEDETLATIVMALLCHKCNYDGYGNDVSSILQMPFCNSTQITKFEKVGDITL